MEVTDPEYWRRLCPELHCCDAEFQQRILANSPKPCKRSALKAARGLLIEEGFAVVPRKSICWSVAVERLAAAVLKMGEVWCRF